MLKYMLALIALPYAVFTQGITLDVLTYNIRRAGKEKLAHRCWDKRKQALVQQIKDTNAHIIGLQEVTPGQLDYVQQHLNKRYAAICTTGRGKSWSRQAKNEANPIFYDTSALSLVAQGAFRLDDLHKGIGRLKALFTPSKHGLLPRICSWAFLKEHNSNKTILVFNTHLDNKFDRARINGLKRITQCMQSLKRHYSPDMMILMGDFNTNLTRNIKKYTASLHDTRQHAKKIRGPGYTHPGWDHDQNRAIDHILIDDKHPACVEHLEVIDYSATGTLLSDHWPVKVTLSLT